MLVFRMDVARWIAPKDIFGYGVSKFAINNAMHLSTARLLPFAFNGVKQMFPFGTAISTLDLFNHYFPLLTN